MWTMYQIGALVTGWGFVYRPDGRLVISSCSFDAAMCGRTRTEGEEEREPGCLGTDPRLWHLHKSGCERWRLEEHMETQPVTIYILRNTDSMYWNTELNRRRISWLAHTASCFVHELFTVLLPCLLRRCIDVSPCPRVSSGCGLSAGM